MIYDIHTKQAAETTLVELTGIPLVFWRINQYRVKNYKCRDDFILAMIQEYGQKDHLPRKYTDMEFRYIHVTTSANECLSIRTSGIMDLRSAYSCVDSELRRFLNAHDIYINLDNAILSYNNHNYDIYYGMYPDDEDSIEHLCWCVGRKFYYDYATCGFLSVMYKNPYGGLVHRRPEILLDLDRLLGTHLSEEWEESSSPYEIIAKVSGNDICYFGEENQSDEEKVLSYVGMAYDSAFHGLSEEVIIINNGVIIPPQDILEINPLSFWVD